MKHKYKCLHCGEVYDMGLAHSPEDIRSPNPKIVVLGHCAWMSPPRYGLHICFDGTHSTSIRLGDV